MRLLLMDETFTQHQRNRGEGVGSTLPHRCLGALLDLSLCPAPHGAKQAPAASAGVVARLGRSDQLGGADNGDGERGSHSGVAPESSHSVGVGVTHVVAKLAVEGIAGGSVTRAGTELRLGANVGATLTSTAESVTDAPPRNVHLAADFGGRQTLAGETERLLMIKGAVRPDRHAADMPGAEVCPGLPRPLDHLPYSATGSAEPLAQLAVANPTTVKADRLIVVEGAAFGEGAVEGRASIQPHAAGIGNPAPDSGRLNAKGSRHVGHAHAALTNLRNVSQPDRSLGRTSAHRSALAAGAARQTAGDLAWEKLIAAVRAVQRAKEHHLLRHAAANENDLA